jgi:uncharacterized secreted repeat protein (TIGR03808 family)
MEMTRRRLLAGSLIGAAALAAPAAAAPLSRYGIDAGQFGVRPGAPDDQSAKLQRAINKAAATRTPLALAPGVYRAGGLRLSPGAQIIGVRDATYLTFTGGNALISAEHSDGMTLTGLTLQGGSQKLPAGGGLIQINDARALRITDCAVSSAEGNGITLDQCGGAVTGTTITNAAGTALFANNSRGLIISANTIRRAGNGGIAVWQSAKRYDGTLIADNTIEDIRANAGGTGQNGNAIAVFRAGDVIVRGNHIRNTAFSAIRGNSAANIQILGNSCLACDDVALYSEFDFEGCIMADNVVDGAGSGISVTNFDFKHGRLASVRGNVLRDLKARAAGAQPQDFGLGLHIEGDTVVTGNVIEQAALAGVRAGWGPYLRNVAITGNVLRQCAMGVQVSVVKGVGQALIADNVFAEVPGGAVVGMEWRKTVTGDLTKDGAQRFPQLTIANNRVG